MEIYGRVTMTTVIGVGIAIAAIVLTEVFVRRMFKDD